MRRVPSAKARRCHQYRLLLKGAVKLHIEEPAIAELEPGLSRAGVVLGVLEILQDAVPCRRALEVSQRVRVLCGHPLLRLCALAIFEPAIVIHNFYPVVLVCYGDLCRNRGWRSG